MSFALWFILGRSDTPKLASAWLRVGAGLPRDNDISKRTYRGVNPLLQFSMPRSLLRGSLLRLRVPSLRGGAEASPSAAVCSFAEGCPRLHSGVATSSR
jgi:hypothetical protein